MVSILAQKSREIQKIRKNESLDYEDIEMMERNRKVIVNLTKNMNHLHINPVKEVQYFEAGYINIEKTILPSSKLGIIPEK